MFIHLLTFKHCIMANRSNLCRYWDWDEMFCMTIHMHEQCYHYSKCPYKILENFEKKYNIIAPRVPEDDSFNC